MDAHRTGQSLPDIVKTFPHVAFGVENLKSTLKNKKIIIEPNSPGEGMIVAFILEDVTQVELLQFVPK
jgi:hypothetical protein